MAKDIAIVGVEQSGKTALMISWGWHYISPDRNGYYLSPDPNGGGVTRDFVCEEMDRMKKGKWPEATSPDSVKRLTWVLGRKGYSLGEMSFVDFGGEIYRKAFRKGPDAAMALDEDDGDSPARAPKTEREAVRQLRLHVRNCKALVILLDLGYVINNPPLSDKRAREMVAVVQCMLEIMRRRNMLKQAAIVFSQADQYESTLKALGSPRKALQQYLPEIAAHYPMVPLFTVSAVNRTVPSDSGFPVPASDFQAEGLEPLTKWVAKQMVRSIRRTIGLVVLILMLIYGIGGIVVGVILAIVDSDRSSSSSRADARYKDAESTGSGLSSRKQGNIEMLAGEASACIQNADIASQNGDYATAENWLNMAGQKFQAIASLDTDLKWEKWVTDRHMQAESIRTRCLQLRNNSFYRSW